MKQYDNQEQKLLLSAYQNSTYVIAVFLLINAILTRFDFWLRNNVAICCAVVLLVIVAADVYVFLKNKKAAISILKKSKKNVVGAIVGGIIIVLNSVGEFFLNEGIHTNSIFQEKIFAVEGAVLMLMGIVKLLILRSDRY